MRRFDKIKKLLSYPFNSRLKKIFFIVFLIFIGILLSLVFNQGKKEPLPESFRIKKGMQNPKTAPYFKDLVPKGTTLSDKPPAIPQAPQFNIKAYHLQTDLPSLSQDLNLYVLKTDFLKEEVKSLANNLLGENPSEEEKENQIVFSNSAGFLSFDLKTGGFSFQTFIPKPIFSFETGENFDPRQIVALYLKKLGIIDETVKATAYYKRESAPKTTFVEFHRDWEKAGLPILNPVGIINLAESQDFEDLSLTAFFEEDIADQDIVFASDVFGKMRKADFNTLTVAVHNDGSLVSIESSLRPIEKIENLASLGLSLLEPEKIIAELEKGSSYFEITMPSGQGVIDLAKVYPDNKLSAKKATITDLTLALMEKPKGVYQKYLQPVYLVRGDAETETGIRVKFAQTVPAIEDQALTEVKMGSPLLARKGKVLAVQDQNLNPTQRFFLFVRRLLGGPAPTPPKATIQAQPTATPRQPKTIKLETFVPSPSPSPSSTPTLTPIPTPTPTTPVPTSTPTLVPPTATPEASPSLTPTSAPISTVTATPPPPATPTPVSEVICWLENANDPTLAKDYGKYQFVEGLGTLVVFETINRNIVRPFLFYVAEESDQRTAREIADALLKAQKEQLSIKIAEYMFSQEDLHQSLEYIYSLGDPSANLGIFGGFALNVSERVCQDLKLGSYCFGQSQEYNKEMLDQAFVNHTLLELSRRPLPIAEDFLPYSLWSPIFNHLLSYITGYWWYGQGWQLHGPCRYLSGQSPTLYFYPQEEMSVKVEPKFTSRILYSDPYWQKWDFTAYPSGQLDFDSQSREKIYYEYAGIIFNQPQKGWLIRSKSLEKFSEEMLSPQLGLNQKEKEALLKEVKGSLIGKKTRKYIFVSLIPQEEIREKLPLEITPQPDNFHRLHLYLEFLDHPQKAVPDDIIAIDRSGFTVVELGVYVKE